MRWVNAGEKLPDHNEEVLIRRDQVFSLALYDADKHSFVCRPSGKTFDPRTVSIWWLRLKSPYTVNKSSGHA